jgi:glycosyltransferase involved in cell wall biosynthesis
MYKDEKTVRLVAEKAVDFFNKTGSSYEILMINDGSPDDSGKIADQLALQNPKMRVIHHPKNLGYGAAIQSAIRNAKGKWICLVDGDDEYDVFDFEKLIKHQDHYDLIITFRYIKMYSGTRQFISFVYNWIFRFLFRTNFRDISTGLRMIRKSMIDEIELESLSPFIGAELTVKSMLKGYRIGEVGIQTFPRQFGRGNSVSSRNIIATIKDMFRLHGRIFSESYDLPKNRNRH